MGARGRPVRPPSVPLESPRHSVQCSHLTFPSVYLPAEHYVDRSTYAFSHGPSLLAVLTAGAPPGSTASPAERYPEGKCCVYLRGWWMPDGPSWVCEPALGAGCFRLHSLRCCDPAALRRNPRTAAMLPCRTYVPCRLRHDKPDPHGWAGALRRPPERGERSALHVHACTAAPSLQLAAGWNWVPGWRLLAAACSPASALTATPTVPAELRAGRRQRHRPCAALPGERAASPGAKALAEAFQLFCANPRQRGERLPLLPVAGGFGLAFSSQSPLSTACAAEL